MEGGGKWLVLYPVPNLIFLSEERMREGVGGKEVYRNGQISIKCIKVSFLSLRANNSGNETFNCVD